MWNHRYPIHTRPLDYDFNAEAIYAYMYSIRSSLDFGSSSQ